MPHLPGFRRASEEAAPPARAVRRALPPVGRLRRELLLERCGELVALEEQIAAAVSRGRVRPAVHCECGAAVFAGARFCAQCGCPLEAK